MSLGMMDQSRSLGEEARVLVGEYRLAKTFTACNLLRLEQPRRVEGYVKV